MRIRQIAALGALGLTAAAGGAAADDYGRSDAAWVSMKGEVAAVREGGFDLSHQGGTVTVEMDDADGPVATPELTAGDEAVVFGYAERDDVSVEAAGVWNATDDRYYYASGRNDEAG